MHISALVQNLEGVLDNFEEFGVTESVKSLLMDDPRMAERIEGQTDDQIVDTIKELHTLAVAMEAAKTINDPVLGKLTTKQDKWGPEYTRWGTFEILGKKRAIKISIDEKKIEDIHRNSYTWFKKNIASLDKEMRKGLTEQAKDMEKEDPSYYTFKREHIEEIVITDLFLNHNPRQTPGNTIAKFALAGECAWEDEHGFSISVIVDKNKKVAIGFGPFADVI